VAVCGDSHILDSLHLLTDGRDQVSELGRDGVADGVGNVQCGGSHFDDRIQHVTQKVWIRASRILRGELNIIAERLGKANRFAGLLYTLIARDTQLVFQVNIGCCQNNMNAWLRRVFQSFPSALNIGLAGSCQCGNDRPAHRNRNRLHRLEVSI